MPDVCDEVSFPTVRVPIPEEANVVVSDDDGTFAAVAGGQHLIECLTSRDPGPRNLGAANS